MVITRMRPAWRARATTSGKSTLSFSSSRCACVSMSGGDCGCMCLCRGREFVQLFGVARFQGQQILQELTNLGIVHLGQGLLELLHFGLRILRQQWSKIVE